MPSALGSCCLALDNDFQPSEAAESSRVTKVFYVVLVDKRNSTLERFGFGGEDRRNASIAGSSAFTA